MHRRQFVPLLAYTLLQSGRTLHAAPQSRQPSPPDYVAWVQKVFERMQTIKPGMTRKQLLKVFNQGGGMSMIDQAIFVSRDCSFFQVRVTFKLTSQIKAKPENSVPFVENPRDVILTMSQFYLNYEEMD